MLDKWLNPYTPWANFILRLCVGWIALAHGAQKAFGVFGATEVSGAHVTGWIELLAGTALVAGLLTRYVALITAVVMAGTMVTAYMANGFFLPRGIEFMLTLFAASLTLLIGGPGEFAFDGWFRRRGVLVERDHKQAAPGEAA